MLRFVDGSEQAWDELAQRAQRGCFVVRDCRLPPGCDPSAARVGFEIQPAGSAILYVDKAITYRGDDEAVRAWLAAGERRFADIGELRHWIVDELGSLYRNGGSAPRPAPPRQPGSGPVSRTPDELTDLDSVTATDAAHAAALVDEDELLRELKSRVYGQDDALATVARRVCRHVGRSRPRRPATLFAVGPTGVGKTRTAEALAESLGALLGGRWSSLVRLNMNEYQERHRVSQILGAPPSYVGYGDGTLLIDRLVAQPESIILFDEIEKAHPDILVALMSAMDAGELSSPAPAARGRAVDCRRAVFYFTSNIDAADVLAELDAAEDPGSAADRVCRRLLAANGIKPELIGRIGGFGVFRPLSARARAEIATAAVVRVAAEYGLRVEKVAAEIVSEIVNRPDDRLGARPDEYYIDDLLGPAFAQYAVANGESTVVVEAGPVPLVRART